MKKLLLSIGLIFGLTAVSNAQFNGNFETLFGIPSSSTTITKDDGLLMKSGIVFIGETRELGEDLATLHTMKYEKNTKTFAKANDEKLKMNTRLSFNGAAGLKDNLLPLSRIIQFKPTASGVISMAANHGGENRMIIVAVLNGNTFTPIAQQDPRPIAEKNGTSGNDATPFLCTTVDYTYTPGDEIWIYSNQNIYFWGFDFSGGIDPSYTGTNPQTLDVTTSIDKVYSTNIISTEYYNLGGIRVNEPIEGVYIVKEKMENGSVHVTKRVFKKI